MGYMPKILVTGGAGYIGSVTTHHLLNRGFDVAVIDDLSRGHRQNVAPDRLHTVRLQDTGSVARLLEGVDAVIHFAAHSAVGESMREPELYFANNVGGTVSLLEAMARSGVRRLVFSSTAAVYGNPEKLPHSRRRAHCAGKSVWGVQGDCRKNSAGTRSLPGVAQCRSALLQCVRRRTRGRLGEAHEPETHLIPLLLRAVAHRRAHHIFGDDYATSDGTCIRDYIHVSDLATAHLAALDHLMAGGASGAFNVGTGRGQTVMEVLRAVEEVTGARVPFKIAPRREGDPTELVADATRLRETLAWEPKHSEIHEIVRDAWAYFQTK